jgi:hypothetical protein
MTIFSFMTRAMQPIAMVEPSIKTQHLRQTA